MQYQLLPDLATDDFDRLKSSIQERGIKVPVVLDENGKILDGHNRVKIAEALGIDYPRIVESGLAEHEKRIFVAELNAARRQLTDAQKVLLGRQIESDIAERARLRSQANLKRGESDPTPIRADARIGETRDEVAKTVQIGSGDTYERGKKTIARLEEELDGPELIKDLESGKKDMADARKEVREREKAKAVEEIKLVNTVIENQDDGGLKRTRIRSIVSTAIQHVGTNLTPLSPEAVAASLDETGRYNLELFMRNTRSWFDRVEAEMNKGIHVVR